MLRNFLGLALSGFGVKVLSIILIRSERENSLPRTLREVDLSGVQLDLSWNRPRLELVPMRADCVIMAHQLVVTQLSRNPIRRTIEHGPSKQLQDVLTVSYYVDLFDHGWSARACPGLPKMGLGYRAK